MGLNVEGWSWSEFNNILNKNGVPQAKIDQIKSIWDECDLYDDNGNPVTNEDKTKKGDGKLNLQELQNFDQKFQTLRDRLKAVFEIPSNETNIDKIDFKQVESSIKENTNLENMLKSFITWTSNNIDREQNAIKEQNKKLVQEDANLYRSKVDLLISSYKLDELKSLITSMEDLYKTDNPQTPEEQTWMDAILTGKKYLTDEEQNKVSE